MEEATVQTNPSVEENVFEFPAGIYGFPEIKRYIVTSIPGGGDVFKQMIAVDQPELGFTLVQPSAFFADYAPDITDDEFRELGAESPEQIVVMAIVIVPQVFKQATANLKAPLLFNPFNRKARQVILADERYAARQPLFKA